MAAQAADVPVHIFWDLDNIRVPHMGHLPLVARRMLHAVEQHVLPQLGVAGGRSLPLGAAGGPRHLTAYANENTLARLWRGAASSQDAQALAALSLSLALQGGRLVVVPVRR